MNRKPMLIAAAMLAVVSCNLPIGRQPAEKLPVKVRTMTVGCADQSDSRSYLGKVEAARSVTLRTRFGGTLETLNVHKGGLVNEGQTVATIRSQSVESALQTSKSNLRQAQDGYDRMKSVYASGGVSEVQMVDIETKLEKAKSALLAAQDAFDNCNVKAPYSGVVSETHNDPGVELAPGQAIATIMDISSLKLSISVHENEINSVKVGQEASVDIPALELKDLPAVVKEKSLLSSIMSHSYECTLDLRSKVPGLMPGMAVKVRFIPEGTEFLPIVPAAAVQLDADGSYVWVDDGGVVRKARVKVGGYSGRGVIVSEGVNKGDRIIVEGYQKVSSGMRVTQ